MIAATYVQNLSIVLPVHPVSSIKKLTPEEDKRKGRSSIGSLTLAEKRQERPVQDTNSFAAMLEAMIHAGDLEDSPNFHALA